MSKFVIKTYNAELEMNQKSFDFWSNLLSDYAIAYDKYALKVRAEGIKLSSKELHKALYDYMRWEFPSLSSQMCIKCYKAIGAAWKTIKKNHQWNEVTELQRSSLQMNLDKRLYSRLTLDGIYITGETEHKRTFYKIKQYEKLKEMFSLYTHGDPLIFIRGKRAFLSIPFNVPCEENDKGDKDKTSVGIDRGARRLFVTSYGYYFDDKKYKGKRRHIRFKKRQLKKKNTKSSKKKLKKFRRRETNLSNDLCHRASNALLNHITDDVIVLEDLKDIKKNTSVDKYGRKRTRHNNYFSQIPLYKFQKTLTHKALRLGKSVETVDPAYTSQKDYRTGECSGTRRGRRYYTVDNIVFDSDWNGALNIALSSKHPVSNLSVPRDGTLRPVLDGQGRVTGPNVGRNADKTLVNDMPGNQALVSLAQGW